MLWVSTAGQEGWEPSAAHNTVSHVGIVMVQLSCTWSTSHVTYSYITLNTLRYCTSIRLSLHTHNTDYTSRRQCRQLSTVISHNTRPALTTGVAPVVTATAGACAAARPRRCRPRSGCGGRAPPRPPPPHPPLPLPPSPHQPPPLPPRPRRRPPVKPSPRPRPLRPTARTGTDYR